MIGKKLSALCLSFCLILPMFQTPVFAEGDTQTNGDTTRDGNRQRTTGGQRPRPATYTVNFDSAGGTEVSPVKVKGGKEIGTLPASRKEGYSFAGWYTEKDGGSAVTENTVISKHTVFYAHWGEESEKLISVTFNAMGGTAVSASRIHAGDKIGTLPETTKPGYTFIGWFTGETDGTQVSSSTTVNANTTFFAHWATGDYKITFDAQGGSAVDSATYFYNDAIGELPVTTKNGSTFLGWFTEPEEGEQIDAETKVKASVTYYAHWEGVTGWIGNKYYKNGDMVKGQLKDGGYWYFLDPETGEKKTGFVDISAEYNSDGAKTCYYDSNGHMLYGAQHIGSYWYYFNENTGSMYKGWRKTEDGSTYYYYDTSGHLLFGQQKINGYYYYFDDVNGKMVKGFKWIDYQNKLVCYDLQGRMCHGSFTYNGNKYFADNSTGAVKAANVSSPYAPNLPFTQNAKYGTNAIVNAHRYDFTASNFSTIIKNNGGYNKYIKSLGGVFTIWADRNTTLTPNYTAKSAQEFQEAADYVFGLVTMYGFNYTHQDNNGNPTGTHVWGSQGTSYANDAYYYNCAPNVSKLWGSDGNKNTSSTTIDLICSGQTKGGMFLNCGWGVTYIYRKAGIISADAPNMESEFYSNNSWNKTYRNKYGAKITASMSPKNFKVGDLIGFFNGSTYKHVAIVVAVDSANGTYTLYDSGSSKLTSKRGNNLKLNMSNKLTGSGGYYGYDSYKVMRLAKDYKGNKINW